MPVVIVVVMVVFALAYGAVLAIGAAVFLVVQLFTSWTLLPWLIAAFLSVVIVCPEEGEEETNNYLYLNSFVAPFAVTLVIGYGLLLMTGMVSFHLSYEPRSLEPVVHAWPTPDKTCVLPSLWHALFVFVCALPAAFVVNLRAIKEGRSLDYDRKRKRVAAKP